MITVQNAMRESELPGRWVKVGGIKVNLDEADQDPEFFAYWEDIVRDQKPIPRRPRREETT